MLEIRLLGQFDIRLAGAPVDLPSRPAQSLLAYLVLNPGVAHRREKLAGLLWPEATDANARGYLRKALWHLRKAIPPGAAPGGDYWRVDEIAIAFNGESDYWLDTAALQRKSENGAGLPAEMQAVAVYRGELLPGFYDDWAVLERERLAASFEQRMGRLLEGLMATQDWPAVLDWGERWIALGGAPEPAFRALMLAHARQGDLAQAAAAYQRCQESLARELGVEPAEQTRALYAQLRAGAAATGAAGAALVGASPLPLAAPAAAAGSAAGDDELPAPGAPPFKGLQCFQPGDSELFFGREQTTAALVERLRHNNFLAIVGASGSGKSSLVRAGLVPALSRQAGWTVTLLTPTANPLAALAAAMLGEDRTSPAALALAAELAVGTAALNVLLRKPPPPTPPPSKSGSGEGSTAETPTAERLSPAPPPPFSPAPRPPALLVVDQFEELFTLCRGDAVRQTFVDNLMQAALDPRSPARVVIALRADFYAHCAQYPQLRAALAEHQAYIGPMTATELRRAIEAPARLGGWGFEPGLVDWVLREAGDEPGRLPLLSHALLETWQRRRGHTLTFQGYAACGGVPGAIAKTAETVFNHTLTPQQQPIARRIFLQLTELGEGTQDTRRQASLAELMPQPEQAGEVSAVLSLLAEARLVTLAEGTVEVAHEALIREWPALRQWLAEDRDGLRLRRRLSEAAQEWDALDRDPGALYRGVRLAQTLEWAEAHPGDLNPLERDYLVASRLQAEGEAAEEAVRQQRELEASQKLAAAEKQRADESGRAAAQLRRRAIYLTGVLALAVLLAGAAAWLGGQARQAAAVAQANERVALARELAAAAVNNLNVDPERGILLALQAVNATYAVDGSVATEAEAALHSALQASRVEQTISLRPDQAVAAAFSPDGQRLATAGAQGMVTVWDRRTAAPVFRLDTQAGAGSQALAFSPDGARLATAGPAGSAEVWDGATGRAIRSLAGHTDTVLAIAFSADGTRLATASADGSAKLWDAASGQLQATVLGRAGPLLAVAFSRDGTRLAAGSSDGTLNVWQVAAGRPLHLYSGAGATALAFSPDGARLAGVAGATLTVWDAWTGQALRSVTLAGHTGQVLGAAFSPDGTRLATGSQDRRAIVWDLTTGQPLLTLAGHTGPIGGLAFSADGDRLATASDDGTARVWNVGLSRELFTQPVAGGPSGRAAISPDGSLLAVGAGATGLTEIFDAASGQLERTLTGTTAVDAVAFDPAGARLALAGQDQITIWDTANGQPVPGLRGPAGPINSLAFSHDGTRLAAGSAGGAAQIWSLPGGQPLRTVKQTAPLLALALSPDGGHLATAGTDATTHIWDSATGALVLTLTSPSAVRAITFSPSGALLATATDGGLTQLWSVGAGAPAAAGQVWVTLSGHTSQVVDVAFSADGQRVATASRDGTAKLWDAASGQLLLTLAGGGRGLSGVVFSPDGTRLFTSGDDGLRGYLLRIEDLTALARARVTRSLTAAECEQYLHTLGCGG